LAPQEFPPRQILLTIRPERPSGPYFIDTPLKTMRHRSHSTDAAVSLAVELDAQPKTSLLTQFAALGFPSNTLRMFSDGRSRPYGSLASWVTPAMCGLKNTFSRVNSLFAGSGGSPVEHVEARAAQLARAQRFVERVLVHDAAASAVFTRNAVGFISPSVSVLSMLIVSGPFGQ
jgi:hypothetical protein